MSGYLHLLLLGLGAGSLYAMSALGLVLVYRSSGIVNFAHGAAGMVGAFTLWDLTENAGWATAPAAVAGVLLASALGLVTYYCTMVMPRRPSTLTRVVATLSVLVIVQAAGFLRYGTTPRQISDFLPNGVVSFGNGITVSADRLILLGITVVLALALGLVYQRSRFGVATSAVAERPLHLAALGWRVGRLRAVNWALGGALGGLAGVLLAPISGVTPSNALTIIVPVLAAALLGGLSSFSLTLAGGLLIGVLQAEFSQHNFGLDGLPDAVPLLAIIVVLAVRGSVLPLRSFVGEKLPRVGNGEISPALLGLGTLGLALATALTSDDAATALTTSLLAAIVVLSLTVVLGYAGQLSLAQVTLAGVGALLAAHLAGGLGLPFLLTVPLAALGTVPAGLLVGLPSLRARGVSLAIATLGLAIAVQALVFRSESLAGGLTGVVISEDGSLNVLGADFDSFLHPHRFAFLVLGVLILLALLVANLRRGRAGRRLVAVRANERAASALGVNVVGAKLAAFALASAIAGVGGALMAYRNPTVTFEQFGIFGNIMAVAFAVVGGVGSAVGGLLGGLLQDGGIGTWLLGLLGDRWSSYLSLIGGVSLLLSVAYYPDGVASALGPVNKAVRRRPHRRDVHARHGDVAGKPRRVAPAVLEIRDLSVQFGGVRAVADVSMSLAPGEVVAIIGPNGAGKTTLIDAVSGFVPAAGVVVLGGRDLTGLPPHRRAAAGLARSWQSLELFEDLTVRENLRIACDPQDAVAYLVDLVRPHRGGLSPAASAAIEAFELDEHLDVLPEELSTGQRKLVAMARAIAGEPSVLLLDEPCSGLDLHERADVVPLVRSLADEWGMGVLLVEHDVDLVRRVSDRVIALDFGMVIASGAPDDVLGNDQVARAYLGPRQQHKGAAMTTIDYSEVYPQELGLLIGGRWAEGSRETLGVLNPANRTVLARLPVATHEDVDLAVEAATGAFPEWRATPPEVRGRILRDAASLLRKRVETIATIATLEQGKTRTEMRLEVEMAAAALEWSAEEGRRCYGRVLPTRAPGTRTSVVREPVGPVVAMTPWNFPVVGPARKLGPALAAGCTCILKPAEETPASALQVARALVDAGLPEGVLSVVFGNPAELSRRLLVAPGIRKLSFTGSTTVGTELLKLAADTMKRTTMELGGHAPVIVLDDADVATTLAHSVYLKYRNAGQICISPTRFFIHEAVYEQFASGFATAAEQITVGNGLDDRIQMGPLANERRLAAVSVLVEDAKDRGAEVLAGGRALEGDGWFYSPTVLGDVPDDARIMNEEPFGPVALLRPVSSVDEAVEQANRLPYGLAAYAFTQNGRRAREIGERLEAGIIGVNTYAVAAPEAPFGGVKGSGFGAEDGIEGVDAHLVTKALYEA